MLTSNLQNKFLSANFSAIPPKGEVVVSEPIRNHCFGFEFLDDRAETDQKLNEAIDKLSQQIPGFCFGRFDSKCRS